jgi:hypothetical protein
MAFSARLKKVLLFGGQGSDFFDDTWVWNGSAWRTKPFTPSPAARCCTAMVYDPVLKGLLLFGGSLSFQEGNDTWLFK